jgi:hypothetical protein
MLKFLNVKLPQSEVFKVFDFLQNQKIPIAYEIFDGLNEKMLVWCVTLDIVDDVLLNTQVVNNNALFFYLEDISEIDTIKFLATRIGNLYQISGL